MTNTSLADLTVPPHSVEAEQAVLGGLMVDSNAWDSVGDLLRAEHFYRKEHQKIFAAMQSLATNDQPIDALTVSDYLTQREELESVGGLPYLAEVVDATPSAANIKAYAEIVQERSVMRELITVSGEIAEVARKPGGKTSQEILDLVENQVFAIAEKRSRGAGLVPVKTVVANALNEIETRYNDKAALTGIASGFADLDRMTSGLQPGDLVIVAGRPSMGKTLLGMNIAEHAAIRSGKRVVVFSLEMSSESIAMRLLSSLARIDQHALRTGKLQDEDWPRLQSAVSLLSQAQMLIDDTPALTVTELRARARRAAKEKGELGLIVIDYLQLMRGGDKVENRTAEISEISRSLKSLAKELNVPVIALSQLNRSLEQRPNKRPVMSDLRESGAIEQDADLIAFIYRDEVYHEDTPDKGVAEIIIGKQRNGPIGTVRLTFLGQFARFQNLANQSAFEAESTPA